MRRRSERNASVKAKASPEKVEKGKRTKTRRRKQSTSSGNESVEEPSTVRETETVAECEKKPPKTPEKKEDSPEEAQDQVWRVKAAEGDVGEIQKLKICLTRPPSTPERVDRSPRSRRKHSRATSSSDTPSVETVDEKKKKHRSKRSRESKDESDKNRDSQNEEPETETESQSKDTKTDDEVTQSTESVPETVEDTTPISTTDDTSKVNDEKPQSSESNNIAQSDSNTNEEHEEQGKVSDADTTVASPKAESAAVSPKPSSTLPNFETQCAQSDIKNNAEPASSDHDRSESVDKSEILEIHAEESKGESDTEESKQQQDKSSQQDGSQSNQVSESEDKSVGEAKSPSKENITVISSLEVIESSKVVEDTERKMSIENRDEDMEDDDKKNETKVNEAHRRKEIERSDSTQSGNEDAIHNGLAAPIVVSRKRRWGSRPSKIASQKSITISTDVLKEIIPDVKPVEFEEVIEDKKHKKIEITEKVERPVLPKIVIDNTENVEHYRKEMEGREKDNVKIREGHLAANRKISIVKDNDSIIARPPSPPRHKQSNILYITNLVRPFTLPQLKNLLQRTGRIVDNGFWIDRIKSKCYVKYATEEQAVETRHALHGVTWPISNPKTLQVDFSSEEAFDKAKINEETDNSQTSTLPGTVEDWLREQDLKRERGEVDVPWDRKASTREWDVGKNDKDKDKDKLKRDDRPMIDKRRHRSPERSPEPARKFKKKEEEAPAKLLDDLFRKTKTTPCIYWLPLSAETIAIKEEQRRQHMAEHERRLQELRRSTHHRRH